MNVNWDPFATSGAFVFNGGTLPEPLSLKSVRLLQRALLQFAPSGFGLPQMRHEAPRRFAVTGDDIRHGARLQLRIPNPTVPNLAPPFADLAAHTTLFEMNLYPTEQKVDGKRVWETNVEADPLLVYTLLLGGPQAPGVGKAIGEPHDPFFSPENQVFPPGTFDPNWNTHHVVVVNEDGTSSPGSWQPLTIL
jgi:hypothetical protein